MARLVSNLDLFNSFIRPYFQGRAPLQQRYLHSYTLAEAVLMTPLSLGLTRSYISTHTQLPPTINTLFIDRRKEGI